MKEIEYYANWYGIEDMNMVITTPMVLTVFGVACLTFWAIMRWRARINPFPQANRGPVRYKKAYEVYGNQFSYNTHCLRLILHAMDIPYRYHEVPTILSGRYGNIRRRYLRINPTGELPTLVHVGQPILHMPDIIKYVLGQVHMSKLWVADSKKRNMTISWLKRAIQSPTALQATPETVAADCLWGMRQPLDAAAMRKIGLRRLIGGFLLNQDWRHPLLYLKHKIWGTEWIIKRAPYRNLLQEHRDALVPILKELQAHLKATGGPYINGKKPSIADFAWACLIHWLKALGYYEYYLYEGAMPHVRWLYEHTTKLPAWQHLLEIFRCEPFAESVEDMQQIVSLDPILNFICYIEE